MEYENSDRHLSCNDTPDRKSDAPGEAHQMNTTGKPYEAQGNRLRDLLRQRGTGNVEKEQREALAELTGRSPEQVAKWIGGYSLIPSALIPKVCGWLGVTSDQLLLISDGPADTKTIADIATVGRIAAVAAAKEGLEPAQTGEVVQHAIIAFCDAESNFSSDDVSREVTSLVRYFSFKGRFPDQ